MTDAAAELDEAYERLAHAGFEDARGFVNHGPMACEALAALDLDGEVITWASRGTWPGEVLEPQGRGVDEETWWESLGDYSLLPDWINYFDGQISGSGWAPVVELWVPRLMPALGSMLYHTVIKTAHAVRAISTVDTGPRRGELARALGYWAARYGRGRGRPPVVPEEVEGNGEVSATDTPAVLAAAAARAARRYVDEPSIFTLHGVTGSMAVHLLADHIPPGAARASVEQLRATTAGLLGESTPTVDELPAGVDDETLARWAAASGDVHTVKLVEACRRGTAATDDPVFGLAAEIVTDATR